MAENKIEIKTLNFPASPPGNDTVIAHNKAHRSDFVRMNALHLMGGIYLDTDAFVTSSMESLRKYEFVLSFDNIVNTDQTKPKRLNNGVLLSAPNSSYLKYWMNEYSKFNPDSFDYDSSVVPFRLATEYPDLVHLEMSSISPVSYFFQTSVFAEAITCGILDRKSKGIWHPVWSIPERGYSYRGVAQPDTYMLTQVRSFVRNSSFTNTNTYTLILIYAVIRAFIHLFVHLLINSINHSFVHSFIHSFIH